MKMTRSLWAIVSLVFLSLSLVGCMETDKANKLVDEGNKSIDEANKVSADAGKKMTDLFDNLAHFPENRDALKSKVDEVNGLLDKSITNLKAAADKFEEASKLKIDDKLKDYYVAKAQSYRKKAEVDETAKKQTALLTDASIDDMDALRAKMDPLQEQLNKLQKEQNDFEDKAKKIQSDNPNLFKKS
jgi:chromosome segregation ATPase